MADSGRTVFGGNALNALSSSITYDLIPETQPLSWLSETVDGDGNWSADYLFVDLGMTQNAGNAFTPAPPRVSSPDPLFTFAEDGLYLNCLHMFFGPVDEIPTRAIADGALGDNQWFSLDTARPGHLRNIYTTCVAPQVAGDEQNTICMYSYTGPYKVELWTATFTSIKIA